MIGLYYTSVETVRAALDVKATHRSDARIRSCLESSSRAIEGAGLLNRKFYPTVGTRYKDWPNDQKARSWVLWLDADEAITITTLTAGGTTIAATDYFLEPVNSGPPYNRIEIDLASSAAWNSNNNTHQRSISIAGTFGHSAGETTAGTTAEVLDASETGVDVADSSLAGIGDLIRVDSERMLITGKTMADTGQNGTALAASLSDVSITGITAGTINVGETLLVDSERMLVTDIAGTTVTVKRAYDGTVLAAHSNGADIYAPRTLTVTRGVLGTTAATHSTGATIYRHVPPGPVSEFCLALTLTALLQGTAGYARTTGAGENEREATGRGLREIREQAMLLRRNRSSKAV